MVEVLDKVAVVELHDKGAVAEVHGMSTYRVGRSMIDCTVGDGSLGDGSRNPLLLGDADVRGGDWRTLLSPKTCWAR